MPACTKHKAAKLAAWESAKAAARERALQTLRTPSDSRQAVDEAVGGVLAFHDAGTFDEIVPMLVERYPNDPDMAGLIGSGCHFFNRLEEACNALRVSLAGKEDPAVRRELGLVLIRMRRAGEAHEVLQPLLVEGHPENLQYWFLLAAACQADGDHRAALDLISDANRLYPETASDKASKSLKAVSEKHLASGKPVVPKILKTDTRRIRETSAPIARFAGPVVVLALAIAFAWWSYHAGQHHQVFLVNGLDRAYEVQWDNATLPLARNGVVPLDTAEGEHSVAAPGSSRCPHDRDRGQSVCAAVCGARICGQPDQVARHPGLVEYGTSRTRRRQRLRVPLVYGTFPHTQARQLPRFSRLGERPWERKARERPDACRPGAGLVADDRVPDADRRGADGRGGNTCSAGLNSNRQTGHVGPAQAGHRRISGCVAGKLAARSSSGCASRVSGRHATGQPGHDVARNMRPVAAEPENAPLKYLLARLAPRPDDETRAYRQACDVEPPSRTPHACDAASFRGGAPKKRWPAIVACNWRRTADFRVNRRSALTAARSWEAL